MTTDTLHPGVVAFDERIKTAKARADNVARLADGTDPEEDHLIAKIAELQERLARVQARRDGAKEELTKATAKVDEMLELRAKMVANDKIAQVVWIKLLLDRRTQ